MEPQIIRTPQGEELVVIPRAEYDALVAAAHPIDEATEDLADAALFAERFAELEASPYTRLPLEVSAAMLKGKSLIRALREWRGATQMELAKAAEVTQGYLSDLETGRRRGTADVLARLAHALHAPAEWLV